jgi:hypothetical protein
MRTLGCRLVRNTTTKYSTTHIQHTGGLLAAATECSQPGDCQPGWVLVLFGAYLHAAA